MFDLSQNNLSQIAEAGYEFNLLLPDTLQDTGAKIKVRGADSKKLRDYARKYIQEQQLKEQKAKRQGKEAPVPTIEEMEESVTKRAVLSIISWSGIAENGQEVPFTEENATRILKEHDWIRSAVLENSNDGSKFRPEWCRTMQALC